MSKAPVRVIIADDHEIFRLGLDAALNRSGDFVVVGEATNGKELINLSKTRAFDLVIADHKMPDMSGLEALLSIKAGNNKVRTILLTVVEDPKLKSLAEAGKIDGYIIKNENAESVLVGVNEVLSGKFVYPEDMPDYGGEYGLNPFIELSRQELQIVRCLALGMSYKDTATELGIQPKTVESHRFNINQKIGKMSIAELTRHALRWQIISEEEVR